MAEDVLPICGALLETSFLAGVHDSYKDMLLPLQAENSMLRSARKEQWNATMAGKGLEHLSQSSMSTTWIRRSVFSGCDYMGMVKLMSRAGFR